MKSRALCLGPRIARLGVIVVVAVGVLAGCTFGGGDGWVVEKGGGLPDFELRDTTGKTVRLSDFAGKPVVLVRFATWCPPCRAELPLVEEKVWKALGPDRVAVVAVSAGEDPKVVADYARRAGLTFPMLSDPDFAYARQLSEDGIPRTIVTDRDHKITALHYGFSPEAVEGIAGEVGGAR